MALSEIDPRVFREPLTWLVVVRQAPIYVRENLKARAWQTVILERETELLLGHELAADAAPELAVKLLREALVRPMAGPPRRPARMIVETANLGALLSAEFDITVDVSDRPLREADQFLEELRRFLDAGGGRGPEQEAEDEADGPSYFDSGLAPSLIRDVINRGSALAKLRPWDQFPNSQLIRLDLPEMGVRKAAICIIGHRGEARAILVFQSADDYMVHLGRGERLANQPEFAIDRVNPGVPVLALNFEEPADFPSTMRDEAAAMGLKRGRNTLYPYVLCVDPDGVRRPTAEPDVLLMVAVATALEQGFRQFGRRFGDPGAWPICMEAPVRGVGVARLTVPFEAGPLFGINQDSLPAAEENPAEQGDPVEFEAMALLLAAAESQFKDAAREINRAFEKDDGDSLTTPWALFHRFPKNADFTLADAILDSGFVSDAGAEWLKAQSRSWISTWHVADSSKDRFSCRDLITGEIRVSVAADPRTRGRLAQGDVFLGRIVDFEEGPRIFGVAAHTLPLKSAAPVIEAVQRALKTTQVTPAMLRSHRGGGVVQREWDKAARARRVR